MRLDVNEDWAHSGIIQAGDFCCPGHCQCGRRKGPAFQVGINFERLRRSAGDFSVSKKSKSCALHQGSAMH